MAYKLKIGPSQSLRLKGQIGFALPMIGGVGIDAAKSGGVWTVSLDYEKMPAVATVDDDTAYILTWDSTSGLYTRLNVTDLKAEFEGTFDGIYQPLDATLTALAALDSTAGLLVQAGEDSFERRTLTGTANEITVTNGAGTAGNPTVSLPASLTFTGKTVTGGTFESPAINTPTGIVKGDVGLGNVDNTSDADKPISTATQTALDGKQPLDADLTAIAGLTFAQGDILYFNGTNLVNLPPGTSGQFLKTLGAAANPAWDSIPGGGDMLAANNLSDVASAATSRTNIGAFGKVVVQTFTSSGTYTPNAKLIYAVVECVGGGGGGGGATAAVGSVYVGAGGGSGGYSRSILSASTIGASQTVTIGAGGSGGAGSNNGVAGGATSLGTLCIANGGGGGLFAASSQAPINGAGATAGTGDFIAPGTSGDGGLYGSGALSPRPITGKGAGSIFGGGGVGVNPSSTAGAANGADGSGYGAGGSGGGAYNAAVNQTGGSGSGGTVIVTEYCSE